MKKLIVALLFVVLAVTPVRAQTTTIRTCTTVYGGGEVCGETTTEVIPEHPPVEAGIDDLQLWQIIMLSLVAASLATLLYKATYRLYIFDR